MRLWRWQILGTCLLSLALSLSWGPYLAEPAYLTFHEVQNWTAINLPAAFWFSPAHVGLLWLGAKLGGQLWLISLVVAGLGWGVTAVLASRLLPVPKPIVVITAVFITLSPVLFLIAGTPAPLYMATTLFALFLTTQQAWRTQTITLCLLPLLYFDVSTVVFMLSLLWLRYWLSRALPHSVILFLIAVYSIWGFLSWSTLSLAGLITTPLALAPIPTLIGETGWLLVPLILLGGFSHRHQPVLWVLILWTAVSMSSSHEIMLATTAVTGWLLVGCGLYYLLQILRSPTDPIQTPILFAITIPILILSLMSLAQWYKTRPIVRFDLETEASQWLRANSQPESTLMASAHILSRVPRSGLAWPELPANQMQPLLDQVQTTAPDYLVTSRTVLFDQLQRSAWFQEHYTALQQFTSPYDAVAPFTIWGYRSTVFNLGAGQPLNVHTDHNIAVVGYQYQPKRLQPGADLQLTLFLQTTGPVSQPINAWLRLTPLNDSQELVRAVTPIMAIGDDETITSHTITATLPADSPDGAYQLSFSLQAQAEENVLALYRNNDVNMLDRVGIGNVIVLSDINTSAATPLNANFGEQITLLSYALTIKPEALVIDLFWQANQLPMADYVVFVHLLEVEGQLAASQDGPPLDGRFPTTSWLPDDIIPDRHIIPLNPDIKGSHQLNIGLYLPATGARLPVWHSDGTPVPNSALTLQTVEIPVVPK